MLRVQACQQHRLVVMQPNKAKWFPAATVPEVYIAKLGQRRRGKRGTRSEERGNMLEGHTRVSKIVDDGEAEACWECCTQQTRRKNEGKNLGKKHMELLSERRSVLFARKKRRGRKRVERKRPPARSTRPPGRGLGWTSSRSARSTFVQQRSTAFIYTGD